MGVNCFKRFRMEIDLSGREPPRLMLPNGYHLLPWEISLLEGHAEAQYLSFRDEIDADVFPCFTELACCRRLLRDITGKEGFLPEATWLAVFRGGGQGPDEVCGTVQGIRDRHGIGSLQNLGITPPHRNRRVGTALLWQALAGFRQAGLRRVRLEVTAENRGAVRLYRRAGFATVKTVYKTVEVAYS
jgi:GNAT superfamily N-acetyltransferase